MPFVAEIPLLIAPKLRADLEGQGFELSTPEYTVFAARKKGISCTLYESGKLVVQGKEMDGFIEFYLEPEILQSFPYTHPEPTDMTPRIGCDEAGKGDFFGPLCVAGVYAKTEHIEQLTKWGVRDSKTMKDPRIITLAHKIRTLCPYHIVTLNPAKYNELYSKMQNLNKLLAWAHSTVIATLNYKTSCKKVIVDQFASDGVLDRAVAAKEVVINLEQRTKAESDVVVAAASMLARAAFVEGIEALGKSIGIELPKGASSRTVAAGKKLVAREGKERLGDFAKLHFRTTQNVLE